MIKLDKKNIKRNFNKSADTYDIAANIQQQCAIQLYNYWITLFPQIIPTNILDIGCGTGFLSTIFAKNYPNIQLILNDISPNMLQKVSEKLQYHKNTKYLCQDATQLPIDNLKPDLIVSNFALQWFHPPWEILTKWIQKNRWLVFTTLLEGTLDTWYRYCTNMKLKIQAPLYIKQQDFTKWALQWKFKHFFCKTHTYQLSFSSPIAVIKYLKKLGAQSITKHQEYAIFRKIINDTNQAINLRYCVMYTIIQL